MVIVVISIAVRVVTVIRAGSAGMAVSTRMGSAVTSTRVVTARMVIVVVSVAMTAAAATTRVTVAMTAATSIVMAIARAISAMTAATASVASSPPRRSANIGSRSVRTI